VQRQLAVDVEAVLAVADGGRAVGHDGMGLDLEEVRRAQVVVALGVVGVDGGQLDGGVTEEASGSGERVSSPWKRVKWPRTLLTIRWRTVKATSEWPGSMV
jgi:hypothetical protein